MDNQATLPIDSAVSEFSLDELTSDPEARIPLSQVYNMRGKSYLQMYWRKPDGDIVFGPSFGDEYMLNIESGWTPLSKYGKFEGSRNPREPGGLWEPRKEPWRRILLHPSKRGPLEFSVQQIRELGWHRGAPYRGVTFPQLAGVPNTDVKCPLCGKLYTDEVQLSRHQLIAHKEQSSNEKLARTLAEATGQNAGPMAEALGAIGQALASQNALLANLQERQATTEDRLAQALEALVAMRAPVPATITTSTGTVAEVRKPKD